MFSNLRSQDVPQVTQTPPIQGSVVWKPPRVGLFKLNFDASVRQGTGTGMGMIVRDHQGQVLVAATYLSDVVMEIREVEATTFRWAIIKAVLDKLGSIAIEPNHIY
ncbi:hypothetical protein GmHk_18G051192 [Glycine max]|nr:hypothetical protein GmHk_18G051192 [Glycine max]